MIESIPPQPATVVEYYRPDGSRIKIALFQQTLVDLMLDFYRMHEQDLKHLE